MTALWFVGLRVSGAGPTEPTVCWDNADRTTHSIAGVAAYVGQQPASEQLHTTSATDVVIWREPATVRVHHHTAAVWLLSKSPAITAGKSHSSMNNFYLPASFDTVRK